jgi:hypothetical protein
VVWLIRIGEFPVCGSASIPFSRTDAVVTIDFELPGRPCSDGTGTRVQIGHCGDHVRFVVGADRKVQVVRCRAIDRKTVEIITLAGRVDGPE